MLVPWILELEEKIKVSKILRAQGQMNVWEGWAEKDVGGTPVMYLYDS